VGNTATIVTTGSIQEIAKYNIYNLYDVVYSVVKHRLARDRASSLVSVVAGPNIVQCEWSSGDARMLRGSKMGFHGKVYAPSAF